ncbi:hypothetical protein B0H14DRAFT_1627264 [Mycena olivaceomarginata]|nr:hypothetical protein B0H14DRAFT_1627264 [Mycena olivaceomarginata]
MSFTQCFVRLGDVEFVFKALCQHCPNLWELEITCEDVGPDFTSVIGHVSSFRLSFITECWFWVRQVWELRNLTVTRHPGIKGRPQLYPAQMFEMLSVCPHPQDLRIANEMRGPAADISDLLASRSWPDPRRPIIGGDLNILAPVSVTEFLARHPQLDVLSLPESIQLPEMPNLRWLYALDFSTVIPARLPQLEYAVAWNAHWDGVMSVLCALPALRGATLAYGELQQDLPHLERLVIAQSPWNLNCTLQAESCLPSAEYRNAHVSGGPYPS